MLADLHARTYLGDGVYAAHDGYQVWVATSDSNRIALEPSVLAALLAYDKLIRTVPQPPTEEVPPC